MALMVVALYGILLTRAVTMSRTNKSCAGLKRRDDKRFKRLLKRLSALPEHLTQVALLAVAYFTGQDFKPAQRLAARERTHWNAWGVRR